jgi:hypothetical protein
MARYRLRRVRRRACSKGTATSNAPRASQPDGPRLKAGMRVEVSGQRTNRRIDVGGRLIHVEAGARTVAAVDVP